MANNTIIDISSVSLSFADKEILKNLSLKISFGSKLSLVGESSSGKTTLLKLISGLLVPDSGTVKVFGEDINNVSPSILRSLRQKMGMQFQSGALFDSSTVMENLVIARYESAIDAQGRKNSNNREEILKMLARVGLASSADKKPHSLSGGMLKRAALARVLITNPDLAIFDEPTAGLDPVTSSKIIDLVNELSIDNQTTMLLATTDPEVATKFSKNLLILNEGRIWAQGHIDDLKKSDDSFVKKFLSRLL